MLEREQAAIAATLLHGPDYLPAGLFAGNPADVLRGLRVHANTISHARLVALEETFPRTRAFVGEGEFNRLSRAFLDAGGGAMQSLADIGRDFPEALADPIAADIARAERAWLESYHAAEAEPLRLADLIGMDEAALLGLSVRLHPAARLVALASKSAAHIDDDFAPGTAALLVTRPAADVRLFALHPADVAVLERAAELSSLGNLIAILSELHPDGGAAIAALIDAGAFEGRAFEKG